MEYPLEAIIGTVESMKLDRNSSWFDNEYEVYTDAQKGGWNYTLNQVIHKIMSEATSDFDYITVGRDGKLYRTNIRRALFKKLTLWEKLRLLFT